MRTLSILFLGLILSGCASLPGFGNFNRGSSVSVEQENLPIAVADALDQFESNSPVKTIRRFGEFPNLQFEVQFDDGKRQNFDMNGGLVER